jgi:hypothetical protein
VIRVAASILSAAGSQSGQSKTGVTLSLPLDPELERIIAATPGQSDIPRDGLGQALHWREAGGFEIAVMKRARTGFGVHASPDQSRQRPQNAERNREIHGRH